MRRAFLCHYHEVALKGGNRNFFEEKLKENIQKALRGLPYRGVRRLYGRIVVDLLEQSPADRIADRLSDVFGLVHCALAWECPSNLGAIGERILEKIKGRKFGTFKIEARRSDKRFPIKSPEINRRLGSLVAQATGAGVRLTDPDLTVHVHVVGRESYLFFEKVPGPGGLPVSTAGKVVVLLSGGIDSPVAAYKVMKRGCKCVFVHFHSFPHTSTASQDKVRRLVTRLCRYQFAANLYMVPFAAYQRQIVALAPAEVRVLLYRRLMLRIAERLARKERAKALVTGDSIGQVASQTLENIDVMNRVAVLPILRPVLTEDKEDIIQLAQKIGTFPISIEPDEDCCSLFVPRNPETRGRPAQIEKAEEGLDIAEMLRDARKKVELERIRPANPDALERLQGAIPHCADRG